MDIYSILLIVIAIICFGCISARMIYIILQSRKMRNSGLSNAQEKDFRWFVDNYDNIYKQYGKCFVAIKNKQIIGVYRTYADGVHETAKTQKMGTFIVQFCNGDKSGYTAHIY